MISLSTICWGRTSAPVHGLCGPSLADDEKNSSCKYFPQTPFGQAQNVWNLPISLPSFSLSLRLQNYPKPVKSSTMEHFSHTHTLHTSSPGDMREGQHCWDTNRPSLKKGYRLTDFWGYANCSVCLHCFICASIMFSIKNLHGDKSGCCLRLKIKMPQHCLT